MNPHPAAGRTTRQEPAMQKAAVAAILTAIAIATVAGSYLTYWLLDHAITLLQRINRKH